MNPSIVALSIGDTLGRKATDEARWLSHTGDQLWFK